MPLPQAHNVLKYLVMAQNRFLHGFDRVPDDRLSWSPGGEAPTPLQLAGKLTRFLTFITHVLADRQMPERTGAPPEPPATREEAKRVVDSGFATLRGAVTGLTERDLAAEVPVPWGQATIEHVLWQIPAVVGYLQGQMNLVQLAYGDTDPNIPPDWGREEV
jgi:hypothetical protein